jgi:GNAT superfamily N-acetyltransferase
MPSVMVFETSLESLRSRDNVDDLFQRHFAEAAKVGQLEALAPSWAHYEELSASGMLHVVEAHVGGELAGYAVAVRGHALEDRTTPVLQMLATFVDAPHRGRGLWDEIRHALRKVARENGVRAILTTAPKGSTLEQLLDRSTRCKPHAVIYREEVL